MANAVYIVIGSNGEYEEYSEYPVCAYASCPHAEEHARSANDVLKLLRHGPRKYIDRAKLYDNAMNAGSHEYRVQCVPMLHIVP